MFFTTVAQQLDKLVLFGMNRLVPDSLAESYDNAPGLEEVLAATQVDRRKTAVYALTAPGEHIVTLQTSQGELRCRVRVRPTLKPQAPLILYHHGLNEYPYTGSWGRIFRQPVPFPAHTVCIQAPHHNHWLDPFSKGFVSLANIYQMFAASLRLMALVQSEFEGQGAAYTIAAGVSWGGITSLLYEAFFHSTRAVAPMVCSPDLAQVMWDTADLFAREMPIPYNRLKELLDFTNYYDCCDGEKVFPLMGEHDLFFRRAHHWQRPSVTIPEGHITALWRVAPLREHILHVLQWAGEQ
jgi:hypothetical protein